MVFDDVYMFAIDITMYENQFDQYELIEYAYREENKKSQNLKKTKTTFSFEYFS